MRCPWRSTPTTTVKCATTRLTTPPLWKVWASLEFVQAHHEGELAGMETYRVYLEASEGDVLTSLSGNDEFALELNTTTSFYQHALGGATPSDINGAMLDMVPELAFDSYVTVGLTQAPAWGCRFDAWLMGVCLRSGIQHLCERRFGQRLVHLAIRVQRHHRRERPHLGRPTHHRRRH